MKKILILLACFFLFSMLRVNAQTYKLTLEKQEGIYYARTGGSLPYKSSQFSIYRLGDNIAYCIEPSKNIKTYNYIGTDGYIDLPYSKELKEKLELIGYYGREYPNHDNVRYSMAAQALIWEATSGQAVTFWTKRYEEGQQIDVTKEKEEIMDLVNHHQVLPNLPKEVISTIKKEIVIKDNNNVLNNFIVQEDGGNQVVIEDNTLTIVPKTIGTTEIILQRKSYDNLKTLIFVGEDTDASQTLGRLRFSDEAQIKIMVNTKGVRLKIQKVDEKGNNVLIPGITFYIKNNETNDTFSCTTNIDGIGITNPLPLGEYEIEEENEMIIGYAWNSVQKKINIQYDNIQVNKEESYYETSFANKKVQGVLEGIKYGEEYRIIDNEIVYFPKVLEEVIFNLYDSNNHLIAEIKTNEQGEFHYENLELGKYYLVEKENKENYQENHEKYYFEIKQANQYEEVIVVKIEIHNYLKKGVLEFTKKDFVTSEGIDDTIVEIYDNENNLLFTKTTDINGKVLLEKLPLGKYYILEKEANSMYQINDEKISFIIKENDEIVHVEMLNERIPVPKTGRNDTLYVHLFCSFGFLIGLTGIGYGKKDS